MLKRQTLSKDNQAYTRLLECAAASVAAAAPLAAQDPNRPIFHVAPAAHWLNDPNGPVFHNGEYHLFYQHNPFGPVWGNMCWGHVVSQDLVYWQHLPIALAPDPKHGCDQGGVFSGSCVVFKEQPCIIYTGVHPQVQCLATSQDGLRTWHKHPHNPLLSHPPEDMTDDFRDPYCWISGNWVHMVVGSQRRNGGGCVLQYRTYDFEHWEYLGVLYEGNGHGKVFECPNFFQMGNKWVLIISPFGEVEYAVGDFQGNRFIPDGPWRVLDFGGQGCFYAPNSLAASHSRQVIWGWVRECAGKEGSPWAGVLTLPRVLSLFPDGQLGCEPLPELAVLRKRHHRWENLTLTTDLPHLFDTPLPDTLELMVDIEVQSALRLQMSISRVTGGLPPLNIEYAAVEGRFSCNGKGGWFKLPPAETHLRLHIFIDHTLVEVYANSRAVITAVMDSTVHSTTRDTQSLRLTVGARGGHARVISLDAWEMGSIWNGEAAAAPPPVKEKRMLNLGNLFSKSPT